jgi:hypothetical protein
MTLFGSGIVTLVPAGANPSPLQIAVLQDVSVEEKWGEKELRGRYQAPLDVARADLKVSGKIKFARLNANMLSAIRAGSTVVPGSTQVALNEAGTIPAPSGPYTIQTANHSTFVTNLGVYDKTAGLWMTCVASAPSTGQYTLSAGTYTFAAADTGHIVAITYTFTVAGGFTVAYANQLMGAASTFSMILWNEYTSSQGHQSQVLTQFGAVRIPGFTTTVKNSDYTMYDLDYAVSEDANGIISTTSTTD